MKQTLSIGFSVSALIIAILSLGLQLTHESPPHSSALSIKYLPAQVLPCSEGEPVKSVPSLMFTGFNHNLSLLSFAMHHSPEPLEQRMAQVSETAGKMLGCAEIAADLGDTIDPAGRVQYHLMLQMLQQDLVATQLAAQEMDEQATHRWFNHVKKDCALCHSLFRAPVAERSEPQVPGE